MRRMTGYLGRGINFMAFFPTAIFFQDSTLIKSHLQGTLHTVMALKELNGKGSGVQRAGQLRVPIPGNLEASVKELHSFPAGEESGHNKACFMAQTTPDPNFLWQLFALSERISFKSQIFELCVGSNDIVGNTGFLTPPY